MTQDTNVFDQIDPIDQIETMSFLDELELARIAYDKVFEKYRSFLNLYPIGGEYDPITDRDKAKLKTVEDELRAAEAAVDRAEGEVFLRGIEDDS